MARVLPRSERGYVGVRLLGELGVVVALVWAVPFVLLDGGYLCAAANGDAVTFGRSNASTADQCSGGWD